MPGSPLYDNDLLLQAGISTHMESPAQEPERETQAQALIRMALSECELFKTPEGIGYASVNVNGHRENWPIRSRDFHRWLVRLYYERYDKPPGAQARQDAVETLDAKAQFNKPCNPVYTRLAEHDGSIYLDLADTDWRAVKISPAGWRVVSSPPARFRRARGMLPLAKPSKGGSIEDLRPFVNVADSDWPLLVAWLVASLRPSGPYPILILQGEQGSSKSTTARVLRALVDPSVSPLRTAPRNERDLMIAAHNSWVLAYDNLSGLRPWLSDAFCRLSTGGGLTTRELYSDLDETIMDAMRPQVLNGIEDVATRGDLLDRSLVLNLPRIPDEQRQDEATFWAAFNEARPRILGALLDAVAVALRNLPNTRLDRLPRMADFARWVTAAEPALPWEPGTFMAAFEGMREDAIRTAVESDPVAAAVVRLVDKGSWQGTASELLTALEPFTLEQTTKTKAWPKTARTLAGRLRRAAPNLRAVGVDVEHFRASDKRRTRLIRIGVQNSVRTVRTVQETAEALVREGFPRRTQDGGMSDGMDANADNSDGSLVSSSDAKPAPHKVSDGMDDMDAKKPTYSNLAGDDDWEEF